MAGFRPTQVVIGIAGELVKGFTTTLTQERKKPELPITDAELVKLIDAVQREALREARAVDHLGDRPAARRRPARPQRDRRRVDRRLRRSPTRSGSRAATSGSGSSTRSRRWSTSARSSRSRASWTSSCWRSSRSRTRSRGSWAPSRSARPGRCSSTSAAGTTDVALVRQGGIEGTRMFALGGRAFTKSIADRLDLPFPRAEALKVDYARGLDDRRARRRSAEIVERRRRGLGGGRGAGDGGARRRRDAAVPDLPVRRRLAPARDPRGARRGAVLEAAAVRPAARGLGHGPGPGRVDPRRDRPARRPAGRDAAGPRVPGDRDPDRRRTRSTRRSAGCSAR